ncbi:GAF domain-containing protein [Patulibacter sp. NPDC049589]|uniref:helix-turn-helix domain-containing protein n=1 Tax=Patulibacter sp. NPDC049589 TaxID=3154731 RepID=UPI0034394754
MATVEALSPPSAAPRSRRAATTARPAGDGPEERAAHAFGSTLARVGDEDGLGTFLAHASRALAALVGVERCSVYLWDRRTGRFRGRVAHPATLTDAVRRVTMGGPPDELTADVVRSRRPVSVPDVTRDARTARGVVREQQVRSLMAVPMIHGGHVIGLAYLDDADRRHAFTPDDERAAMAFATSAARWVDRSLRVAQLATVRDELARERSVLPRATELEQRLAEHTGAPFQELLEQVAQVAGRPIEVLGADGRSVARAGGGDEPGPPLGPAAGLEIARVMRNTDPGHARTVATDLRRGLTHRCVATHVALEAGEQGLLVLVERSAPLSPFDALLAVRAGAALSASTRRPTARRFARGDVHALAFERMLDHGLALPGTAELAERLEIAAAAPRLVALVLARGPLDADDLTTAVVPWQAVPVPVPGGLALVIDLPDDTVPADAATDVRDELVAALDGAGTTDAVVGVSGVSGSLADLPRATAQARSIVAAMGGADRESRPAGDAGAVGCTIDELGPARLLLASPADAGRIALELLGPLLDPDPSIADLLRTLETFCATDASIRATATALQVHENTVRHRFGRIRTMTGLDVAASTDDLLMVRTALSARRFAAIAARHRG